LSTAIAAGVLILVRRERSPTVLIAALAATFLGPLSWNAILHRAERLLHRPPLQALPVSWQDTGSGVFTFAVASLLLGLATRRTSPARAQLALTAAVVAFLVDIYMY
jgi:hypothetical protein